MKLDIITYVKDRWNILDILALTLLAAGFLVRATDGDNPWGRALYALSAPLLFSRLVFFAQLLHFQGPMVQVRCWPGYDKIMKTVYLENQYASFDSRFTFVLTTWQSREHHHH